MQALIDDLAKKYQIPHLSVALATKNEVPAKLLSPYPSYPLYSITKTFIAVVLLKLAEDGKIHLDSQVINYVADAPEGQSYSVRQLLNNSSGLPDYTFLDSYEQAVRARPQEAWTRKEFIENTYGGKLNFAPGSAWLYSNLGFMFLKDVIEAVTLQSFAEALQKYIFLAHGLTQSFLLTQLSDLHELVPAQSTHISPDKQSREVRGLYHPGWVAHGVIASTAEEIAIFFQKLFSGKILSQKSLHEMTTLLRVPGEFPPFINPSYGLGIMADPQSKWGASFGHGGGGPGYALHVTSWPELKGGSTVAAFSNAEHAPMPFVMEEIAKYLHESPL